MNHPHLTAEAREDLRAIWFHIAQNNPRNADRFLERLLEKCRLLAEQPGLGRKRDELRPNLHEAKAAGEHLLVAGSVRSPR